MAAILRDSTVVVVVVVVVAVVRTRPRAIPLSMINHEKIHTWVSFSYMVMGLRLAALRAAGAPLRTNLSIHYSRTKIYGYQHWDKKVFRSWSEKVRLLIFIPLFFKEQLFPCYFNWIISGGIFQLGCNLISKKIRV